MAEAYPRRNRLDEGAGVTIFLPASAQATPRRLRKTCLSLCRFLRRRFFPTPFERAIRPHQIKLAQARSRHAPTRELEAELRAFTHEVLRG